MNLVHMHPFPASRLSTIPKMYHVIMETVFWVSMEVPTKDSAMKIRLVSNAGHVKIIQLLPYFTDPLGPTRIRPMVSLTVEWITTTEYPINNLRVISFKKCFLGLL